MIGMSYTYEIDVQAMFDDRTDQFEKFGIPLGDIEKVRAAVTDMWADAPGGWGYEWSKLAAAYADEGDHWMAALVYGCAKFPCLTDDVRQSSSADRSRIRSSRSTSVGCRMGCTTSWEMPCTGITPPPWMNSPLVWRSLCDGICLPNSAIRRCR
jgi:hypothetical protein